jgi:iron-sulfur cluster assembly protein
MIHLTPDAKEKIKDKIKQRGQGLGIRIGVKTTGCSGLAYVLEYVDSTHSGLDQFEFDDLIVYIDQRDQVYLQGLTVNYVKKNLNEGFEFLNPNEDQRCGCGQSFTVKS